MPGEIILVIDDNAQNLKLAQVLLRRAGYQALGVTDAEAALTQLETVTPAAILMDLQLPGMDGLELTGRLRMDPLRRHIAIIAVTAYAMKGDEAKALAAGCDAYLSKPIDSKRLIEVVAAQVSRRGAGA